MLGDRLTVTARLAVVSPLHVGTGASVHRAELISQEDRERGQNEAPELATVATDHRGWPCIPAPTLKGMMRGLLRIRNDAAWRALFGVDRETSAGAPAAGLGMGRLIVRTSKLDEEPSDRMGKHLPHRTLHAPGAFTATRTRIDRDTGAVQLRKLFHQERVMPGLCFGLSLCLLAPDDRTEQALADLCALLAQVGGQPLGKGRSAGAGRVRLVRPTLKAVRQRLNPHTLALDAEDVTAALRARMADRGPTIEASAARRVLTLTADGPYLTRDPDPRDQERGGRADGDEAEKPQIQPLRRGPKTPEMLATSLKGVLRSRAAWLGALEALTTAGDGPLACADDPDRVYRHRLQKPSDLTPTERLFGVNGWRGLLRVGTPRCTAAGRVKDIHAVSLDRFSMAPIRGALFVTKAHVSVAYRVELTLERRGLDEALLTADREFLDRLIANLTAEDSPPLMIGHGTAKGYGWFTVSATKG